MTKPPLYVSARKKIATWQSDGDGVRSKDRKRNCDAIICSCVDCRLAEIALEEELDEAGKL